MSVAINNDNRNWYIWILFCLLTFSIFLALSSCSCNYHLKQIKKKCNNIVSTDTTYIHDTTFVNRVEKDTVFYYNQRDTVVIREGRLTMKYFYNSHDSTVYLNGKCDTIRIIKEIPYTVTNNEFTPQKNWMFWVFLCLLVLLIINLLRK